MESNRPTRKNTLSRFAWLAGNWSGTNTLWLDPEKPAHESESIMVVGT